MLSANECAGQRFVLESLMESLSRYILLKAPAVGKAKIKQTSLFSSSHAVSYVFVIKCGLRLFRDLNYTNNPGNINCLRG